MPEFLIFALSMLAVGLSAVLGCVFHDRPFDKLLGTIILAGLSLFACIICLIGYTLFGLLGPRWSAFGLVLAIIVVGWGGFLLGRHVVGNSEPGKRRSAFFIPGLWFGFCFASWVGYAAGDWLGILFITLPTMAAFWLILYYLAHFILPLDDQPVSMALRCLLTFSAGTNYPYYVIEDREKAERVPGNQFSEFFAGPGIFLAGPDHVVAVSNGLSFGGARGPGIVFTRRFEVIQEPMDLRTQQRAYEVDATTKDGIPVKFTAFGPFQLGAGDQQPELGKSFPFRSSSIFKAFHQASYIDIGRGKYVGGAIEERNKRRWDEVYQIVGTRVMRDIISEYEFNQLCEPLDPSKNPRKEIGKEYKKRMLEELSRYGIKVPAGGISNLLPADKDTILNQRVEYWRAYWQRRMLERSGEAQAEVERIIGQTRAQVQVEMIEHITDALAAVVTDDREIIVNTIALRFVESLNRIMERPQVADSLPAGVAAMLHSSLPYIIGK